MNLVSIAFCLSLCLSTLQESITPTPNIIILLADDLGYGDLSIYGSQSIFTPHIDSLAREGMRFSHFYTGSAVCTPSRASLLTGRLPLRFDIRKHFTDNEEHLPTSSTTLPELLKRKGYRNAHIGKWHLGGLRPQDYEARSADQPANPGPLQHGFDHSLTSIEGAPIRPELIKSKRLYRDGGQYMVRNDRRAPVTGKHWTEIKIDEAIHFIKDCKDEKAPFFVNLWFDVPHTPYEPAPEPHLSKYASLGVTGDQLKFRSMVSHLDANIGRLTRFLRAEGIFDNTIIVFASDNGPAFQGSPGPFKGGKTDLHEGGIRVPMFAVWPDHIPANEYSFNTVHMADLLPTICDAVDIETENLPVDGVSMLDTWLKKNSTLSRRFLFWQMDKYRGFQNQGPRPLPHADAVILHGKWKMLFDSLTPTELFDLEQDHRELYNLLGEKPDLEHKMREEMERFLQDPRDRSGFSEVKQ